MTTTNHLFNRLITALGQDLNLTGEEIADILWLTLKRQESGEASDDATLLPSIAPTASAETKSQDYPTDSNISSHFPEIPTVKIYPQNPQTADSTGAIPLGVPDALSLREPLMLTQALRPLALRVSSGRNIILDEIATVQRIAAEGISMPVFKPELEPWLDLALVVDESKSMLIWRHTIRELKRLLEHYGIFRDVRTWGLVVDENGEIGIRPGIGEIPGTQRIASPREIIDPSGRRLVLVVSDCVATLWRDGTVISALKVWADSQPVAIAQMLPEWLWQRTGLSLGASVSLGSLTPGVANQHLFIKELLLWQDINLETGIKIPVLTLEPEVAVTWSQMVAGKSDAVASGFVFSSEFQGDAEETPKTTISKPNAEERVHRFRMTASPMARKLAGLLAAAPVMTLPVVRLIQETMLPQSRQVHVAEVFLGGLLKPLTPIEADTNPDVVQYDFMEDQVRTILLESAPVSDSANVVDEVSVYVAGQLGRSLEEFVALLKAPGQADDPQEMKAFAVVTAKILKQLGGDYARFAEDLEQQWLSQPSTIQTPESLQKFTFEVVTVNRRGEIIKKETKQAQYFTENLANGINLEMVAIPGGTFLMGSPEGEGYKSEKPQHEVTVQPFFIGKYPVTQEQWRAVAALPRVDRDLKPDPSRFKGDNRPVEKISWYDAVEFCARISQATGNDYRLPSEAEWEYACRAGTTTPFYFGETITTELANYRGTDRKIDETLYKGSYGEGPLGVYREETTPIGIFPPNSFGLYDMHGNVWEWCFDHWHENYEDAPIDGSSLIIEIGENDNQYRLLRGGSWHYDPEYCRSANRSRDAPDYVNDNIGFRVVCVPPSRTK
ncbi:MAG: formylglycine-generating enzyme family protein [Stigonema ocellatum SAG 48.90 = DSM 106950]|nr:formylglycine-generating enzyme family protein [Stigonema ocellatum SAG 48.90 = DSM 106950]